MRKKIYANDLVPAEAFHPGEILKDELNARDLTQKDFATKMGIRPNVLSEIITGKRNITPALAIKLEAALDFDIKAEQWMRLQVGYEIDKIRKQSLLREAEELSCSVSANKIDMRDIVEEVRKVRAKRYKAK